MGLLYASPLSMPGLREGPRCPAACIAPSQAAFLRSPASWPLPHVPPAEVQPGGVFHSNTFSFFPYLFCLLGLLPHLSKGQLTGFPVHACRWGSKFPQGFPSVCQPVCLPLSLWASVLPPTPPKAAPARTDVAPCAHRLPVLTAYTARGAGMMTEVPDSHPFFSVWVDCLHR